MVDEVGTETGFLEYSNEQLAEGRARKEPRHGLRADATKVGTHLLQVAVNVALIPLPVRYKIP
jgi:hypothetical protein